MYWNITECAFSFSTIKRNLFFITNYPIWIAFGILDSFQSLIDNSKLKRAFQIAEKEDN